MKAVHVPGLSNIALGDDMQVYAAVAPGSFDVETDEVGQRWFWFKCPGPCKSIAPVALRPVVKATGDSWAFDDNMKAPTLNPSVNHRDCWHGWLKAGEWAL